MKKHHDTSLGEPWASAQAALEKYAADMRSAKVHDCCRVCNKHASLMHGMTQRLPKSNVPRVLDGAKALLLPDTGPEMTLALTQALHLACVAEVYLAPTELRETINQMTALLGAEVAVSQLAELIDEAGDVEASHLEELMVADSVERINTHLHHITQVAKNFAEDLTHLYPELEKLRSHAIFLKDVGLIASRSAAYIINQLPVTDPVVSPSMRLKQSAENLIKEAQNLHAKAEHYIRWSEGVKSAAVPNRLGIEKRSLIGLIANHVQGHEGLKAHMPEEEKRRDRVNKKLERRRARNNYEHSSDEEAEANSKYLAAEAAHSRCANCSNVFGVDALFCSRCGTARPPLPTPSGKIGPPALKRIADRPNADDDIARGPHEVWGGKGLEPSKRDVAPQFLQKERIDAVSDDEDEAKTRGRR